MSEKIKLDYKDQKEKRSLFVFDKTEISLKVLRKILICLGFDEKGSISNFEKYSPFTKETISNYSNLVYSVDIVFMEKSIGLIINSEENKVDEITKVIGGFFE